MTKTMGVVVIVALCLSGVPAELTEAQGTGPKAGASAWTPLGPQGGDIRGLARNPKEPNEIYAVTFMGQVYRSMTNGANWSRRALLLNTSLFDVAVDPKTPSTVYALGGLGLFKSTDKGATFTLLLFGPGMTADAGGMAINPINPDIIYVAGKVYTGEKCSIAVLKTANGGKSWVAKKFDAGSFAGGQSIAVCAKSPATVYCSGYFNDGSGGRARLYRSKNAGRTWQDVTPGFLKQESSVSYGLALDPESPGQIYLCCQNEAWSGVARSSDSGASWMKQTTPDRFSASAVACDSGASGALYAGGEQRCFKSVDGGKSWTERQTGLSGTTMDILASGAIVHFGSSAGVFRSANAGAAFKPSSVGIKSTIIDQMAFVAPAPGAGDGAAGTIFAVAARCGLFKSQNAGGRWTRLSASPEGQTTGLIVPADDPSRVYLALYGFYILRSVDGGKSFDQVLRGAGNWGLCLAVDPANKNWVLAAGSVPVGGQSVMGIYRSADGGLTWTQTKIRDDANSYATAVALDPSNRNTVYVAGWTASSAPVFYKSTNGGAAWAPIASPSSSQGYRFASIAVAPDSPKTVYTCSGNSQQEIYKSTNGGSSWTRLANGPSYTWLVAVNPSKSNEVFAAGQGVFYSADGGSTWEDLSTGLPLDYHHNGLTCVSIDSAGRKVYVGTWGGGVCRRSF